MITKQHSSKLCLSSDQVCQAAAAKLGEILQNKKQSMAAFTACTMKERNSNNDIRLSPTLLSTHFDDTAVPAHQSFNSNESRIQLSLNYSKNLSSSFVLPSPPPPSPLTFIASDSEEPIPSESSQSIPVMSSVSSHITIKQTSPCCVKHNEQNIPQVFITSPDGTSTRVSLGQCLLETVSECPLRNMQKKDKEIGSIIPSQKYSTSNKQQPHYTRMDYNNLYRPPSSNASPTLAIIHSPINLSGLSPVSPATLPYSVDNPMLNYDINIQSCTMPTILGVITRQPNHSTTDHNNTMHQNQKRTIPNNPVSAINKLLKNGHHFDRISSSYFCVSLLLIFVCSVVSPLAAMFCGIPALCCSCIAFYFTNIKNYPARGIYHARIASICNIATIISGIVLLLLVNVPLIVILMLVLKQ